MKRKNVAVIAGAAVAIAGALLGVALISITSDDGDDRTIAGDGTRCSAVGDGNNIDCPQDDVIDPVFEIERGESPNSYIYVLQNWKPNSTIHIALAYPDGTAIPYDDFEDRPVDSDGTASTDEGYYFWKYDSGAPVGDYSIRVTGQTRDGETLSLDDTFELPWP